MLFPEVIDNFIESIILFYTFLVISFVLYKEYITFLISLSNFSHVFPAFTCTSAIGNLWNICLGLNILRLEWSETLSCLRSETLAVQARSEKPVPFFFIGNILLSKASRTLSLPSKSAYKFLRIYFLFCFLSGFWGFIFF